MMTLRNICLLGLLSSTSQEIGSSNFGFPIFVTRVVRPPHAKILMNGKSTCKKNQAIWMILPILRSVMKI